MLSHGHKALHHGLCPVSIEIVLKATTLKPSNYFQPIHTSTVEGGIKPRRKIREYVLTEIECEDIHAVDNCAKQKPLNSALT